MPGIRYTEEFKRDAVAQVTDQDHCVREVASRLGISTKSLYDWKSEVFGELRKSFVVIV